MSFFSDLSAKHEALKNRIHSYRLPLGPKGRALMGLVYFSIPCISGYYIMQYSNRAAEINLKDVRENQALTPQVMIQNEALKNMLKKAEEKKQRESGGATTGSSS